MIENEVNILTENSRFFAIPYGEYSCYVLHAPTGRDQADNQIEIARDTYEVVLRANQEKSAEIRIIELENGTLSIKDFYDQKPSDLHSWNRKSQQFEISKGDEEKLISQQNIAFLSYENKRINAAIATLDDAVEFEIATDEEIALHKELRKYRVLLSRVPNQPDWPLKVDWPQAPEF